MGNVSGVDPKPGRAACGTPLRVLTPPTLRQVGVRRHPPGRSLTRSGAGDRRTVGEGLVVTDDLFDDEGQELLGEHRVEVRLVGEATQPRDLLRLSPQVRRRQPSYGLEHADLLRCLEPLRQQVHERGVDVVDAAPQSDELGRQDVLGADGVRHCVHALFSRSVRLGPWTSRGTSVGFTFSRTTPRVMTTRPTSSRLGISNMTCWRTSSMIARRPRAPVPRSSAWSAIAAIASSLNSSSTPSIWNMRWYCLTSALRGSVRMRTRASRSSGETVVMTGTRPMNSGMSPNLSRSSGMTSPNTSTSSTEWSEAPNPIPRRPAREVMISSRTPNAPATMNSTFVVSIWMNSWCGCLRPPCGGTEAVVPSRIFRSACCTPSPETSRVIDGFSLLRAILSTSSM